MKKTMAYHIELKLMTLFLLLSKIVLANDLCKVRSLPSHYKEDCRLLADFNETKSCFDEKGQNIYNLQGYRALRFIDRNHYESQKMTKQVWEMYDPAPKSWIFWEQGNFFRNKLQQDLLAKTPWEITAEDFQNLHRKVVDDEIVNGGLPVSRIPGADTIGEYLFGTTKVGEYRTEGKRTSGFELTDVEYTALKDDPLVTGGYLALTPRHVSYTESALVTGKMNDLIVEVNEKINQYLEFTAGKPGVLPPEESPIEFASRIQRTYVAIHPFHEGCGRTSRLLQELILGTLGFPPLPSGDLQKDITTPAHDYPLKAREQFSLMTLSLTRCCSDAVEGSEPSNPDCRPIYEDDNDPISNSIKSTIILGHNCKLEEQNLGSLVSLLNSYRDLMAYSRKRPIGGAGAAAGGAGAAAGGAGAAAGGAGAAAGGAGAAAASVAGPLSFRTLEEKGAFYSRLLESLAVTLMGEHCNKEMVLKTYTWVTSEMASLVRDSVYSSILFNKTVRGVSEVKNNAAQMGNGFYVSRNPFDSASYGLDEQLPPEAQMPILHAVDIPCHSKIVSLKNEQVKRTLEQFGMNDQKFREIANYLDPNIILDYGRGSQWMNIMLKQNLMETAFSSSRVNLAELSLGELESIRTKFQSYLSGHLTQIKIKEFKDEKGEEPSDEKAVELEEEANNQAKTEIHRIATVRDEINTLIELKKNAIAAGLAKMRKGPILHPYKGFVATLLHDEDYLAIDRETQTVQASFPANVWDQKYLWSDHNTCLKQSGSGFIADLEDQELRIGDKPGNPCQVQEKLELKYLVQLLDHKYNVLVENNILLRKELSEPEKLPFGDRARKHQKLEKLESLINKLRSIATSNRPFVTPMNKCAVIGGAKELVYVAKEYCYKEPTKDEAYANYLDMVDF